MSVISTLKYITSHPLNRRNKVGSIIRFCKWQLSKRLNPSPIIHQYTNRSKLIIRKGMTGATGNLYCGLHDYEDMSFVLHFLREEDSFLDIGANIGSYTVLASGHVGAKTLAFEPVPSTFTHLINNIAINSIGDKVKAYNLALGSTTGSIDFTSTHDTVNHVAHEGDTDVITVPVDTVDNIIRKEQIAPILLKIDVEGFETEVLKGAEECLRSKALKAVIIELNGSGRRFGYDESLIHDKLIAQDFQPFLYNPKERSITATAGFGNLNTIYIRDTGFVRKRLVSAMPIRIFNNEL